MMKPPLPIPPDRDAPREAWADYYEECITKGADQIVTPLGVVNRRKKDEPPAWLAAFREGIQLLAVVAILGLCGWFGWLVFSLFPKR